MTLIGLMLIMNAFTQTNFSGHWKLKEKKQANGKAYANNIPVEITISQYGNEISLERKEVDGRNITVAYPMDGKPREGRSSTDNRKSIKTLTWDIDKKALELRNAVYEPGNDSKIAYTRVATLSLSTDGRQLFYNVKSIEDPEGWEVNGVFVKQ